MGQFNLYLSDTERIKLERSSKWFGCSMTSILKGDGLQGIWNKWCGQILYYDSYKDYLNGKRKELYVEDLN